jgi:hypothetical protein
LPSLALTAFLLAPIVVAAACALAVGRRWRLGRAMALAALVGAGLWSIAFLVTPRTRATGESYKLLTHMCDIAAGTRRYSVLLPPGAIGAMQARGVDRVELMSGWYPLNLGDFTSLRLQASAGDATVMLETADRLLPLAQLMALAAAAEPVKLEVTESYGGRLKGYVGWQIEAEGPAARGGSACGRDMDAFVEVRGWQAGTGRLQMLFY